MKHIPVLTILIASLFFLNSCKKESFDVDSSSSAIDYLAVKGFINTATDESVTVAGDAGDISNMMLFCGASIDTSKRNEGVTTITYAASDCNNYIRTGSVKTTVIDFENDTRVGKKNGVLQLDFSDFRINDVSLNASYTINGTMFIKNTTPGLLADVFKALTTKSVTYKYTADNLNVTLDDSKSLVWNFNYRRIFFPLSGGAYSIKTDADTMINNLHSDCWGMNRNGDAFTNSVPETLTNHSNCGLNNFLAGHISQTAGTRNVDIDYAVDESGNPASVASTCAFGYKVTYTYDGYTKQIVIPYQQ